MFIPTFWFVFFTSFLIAIFLIDPDKIPFLGSFGFRISYVIGYLIFAAFLYFTVIQLLRVDMGADKIYVSNYFKTFTYQYEDIEKIKEENYIIFKLITIKLKSKGSLGQKITFIPSYRNYEFFLETHPQLFAHLKEV